jgi:hypothetical protein
MSRIMNWNAVGVLDDVVTLSTTAKYQLSRLADNSHIKLAQLLLSVGP